jgi:hypothetical protein
VGSAPQRKSATPTWRFSALDRENLLAKPKEADDSYWQRPALIRTRTVRRFPQQKRSKAIGKAVKSHHERALDLGWAPAARRLTPAGKDACMSPAPVVTHLRLGERSPKTRLTASKGDFRHVRPRFPSRTRLHLSQ